VAHDPVDAEGEKVVGMITAAAAGRAAPEPASPEPVVRPELIPAE
jgi:hypothetical protein